MKTLSEVSSSMLSGAQSEGRLVDYIAVIGGWRQLSEPTLSTEINCTVCNSTEHYATIAKNDTVDDPTKRVWICANGSCETNTQYLRFKATKVLLNDQRALEWPLFCEINGIGDANHSIKFESIKQSADKEQRIKSFLTSKNHFLLLQGNKGTGKTYASLGLCEYYTRTSVSCIFITQAKMKDDWLYSVRESNNYVARLKNCNLLVIDDFGVGKMPDGFMGFFMDLMNYRMQWIAKKTIISTNMQLDEMGRVFGDPLVDRICTGEVITFEGHSRRF